MLWFSLLCLCLIVSVSSRSVLQRILIDHQQWEVPDEPGWIEVIEEANAIQEQYLTRCATAIECRRVVQELRKVFLRYPVSRKYLESNPRETNSMLGTIFKWG